MTPNKLALFLLGCAAFALVLVIELGIGAGIARNGAPALAEAATPGIGIRYLAVLDAAVAYTLLVLALEMFAPQAVIGRLHGIATLILSLIGLVVAIGLIVVAIAALALMVALLLAPPFGTLAYFAAFGSFPLGEAKATIFLILLFKLGAAAALVLASPAFLKNTWLVALIALSIGLTFLVGFLIGFVPSFLSSITDALGAIIAAIVGAIWIFITLISSIPAIVRAIRSLLPV